MLRKLKGLVSRSAAEPSASYASTVAGSVEFEARCASCGAFVFEATVLEHALACEHIWSPTFRAPASGPSQESPSKGKAEQAEDVRDSSTPDDEADAPPPRADIVAAAAGRKPGVQVRLETMQERLCQRNADEVADLGPYFTLVGPHITALIMEFAVFYRVETTEDAVDPFASDADVASPDPSMALVFTPDFDKRREFQVAVEKTCPDATLFHIQWITERRLSDERIVSPLWITRGPLDVLSHLGQSAAEQWVTKQGRDHPSKYGFTPTSSALTSDSRTRYRVGMQPAVARTTSTSGLKSTLPLFDETDRPLEVMWDPLCGPEEALWKPLTNVIRHMKDHVGKHTRLPPTSYNKVVVFGDVDVGKSTFVSWVMGTSGEDATARNHASYGNASTFVTIDGHVKCLSFWESEMWDRSRPASKQEVDAKNASLSRWVEQAYGETYDSLRFQTFQATDVFLLCFAVDNPASFYHCQRRFFKLMPYLVEPDSIPDVPPSQTAIDWGQFTYNQGVPKYSGKARVVLCGFKADMRSQSERLGADALVPYEHAMAFARCIGAVDYVEVSTEQDYNLARLLRVLAWSTMSCQNWHWERRVVELQESR